MRWLIFADNTWYTIQNSILTAITDTSGTKSNLFITYGLTDKPDLTYYNGLNNPKIYCWQELQNQAAPFSSFDLTFVPKGQVITMLEDIDITAAYILNIQVAKITSTIVGSPVITVAISLDGGSTYYAFRSNAWVTTTVDATGMATGGMPIATLTSITADQWATLFSTNGKHNYRIAVYMELTDGSQQVSINNIEFDYKNNL